MKVASVLAAYLPPYLQIRINTDLTLPSIYVC